MMNSEGWMIKWTETFNKRKTANFIDSFTEAFEHIKWNWQWNIEHKPVMAGGNVLKLKLNNETCTDGET